ncbi:MAG TPA: hypothetical protein VEH31_16875 [Streptosporangiaceae bacterium]|nr:hypothetical protein [Streptosporangiaceae bacterium]
MPGITLDLADAAELAETLALITEWLWQPATNPRRQLRVARR